jgi:uncharacterized membrane protein YqjE
MDSNIQGNRPNGRGISLIELLRGIVQDARDLSVKELTAAKLEIREEIARAIRLSVSVGIGVFALATGIVFLSLVVALVLADYFDLPIWVGFAIVGGAYTLLGLILLLLSKHKMKEAKAIPRDTLRSAKEDARYVREKALGH